MFMGLIGIVRTVEGVSFIFLRVCLLESFFFSLASCLLKKKKKSTFFKGLLRFVIGSVLLVRSAAPGCSQ